MPKWADYAITAVRYSSDPKHIEAVQACPDDGERLGSASIQSRATVIVALGGETTYVTAYKNAEGKWSKGEDVQVVVVQGEKFIRSDANSKAADNLGNLPTF